MRAFCTVCAAVVASLHLAACGGERAGSTLYFLQESPRPVLAPVTRGSAAPTPTSVVAALVEGPSPAERSQGLRPVIHARVRALTVVVRGRTAVVDYSGAELGLTAASLVLSLTELPGIERVSIRLDGRPCCVYDHDGRVIDPVKRELFRGWSREPCALRTYPDAVSCRG
jgi:spore germination protein GerM